ncbi:MotA/TolQ/ExbB proton channel family protein [Opitutus sp. GAS368]|jgi:biopolymer transport protein ExbB|uniref:MotA/TolQ/ExbB proton channel family protein n=1 Tax=Opitutus sp. GAS368 TaxID=1882749 RepID=UPI00087DB829|nr:MotA/TolQ/ExbB proton channel family protein [Opitutus sp. GAS368]SDS51564.1 biopolymer transport protein ExbB [Opitutus sp. GAS368]
MLDIIKGAGLLIYPLALCSVIAVYIIAERLYALRKDAVLPDELVDAIVEGRVTQIGKNSVLARIVEFSERHKDDPEAVKAFARLEINRMERGVPYLDVIYVVSPMLGLTGTVFGLLRVFSQISPETGLPDPVAFTKGVSLALSATLIGLLVAIIAVVPAGYLQRKVENHAVKIDLLLERILARITKS